MEIGSIPFLTNDEYSYFFQELDTNDNDISENSRLKRQKVDDLDGESKLLKEILNSIAFLDDQEIPGSKLEIPSLDFESRASEMGGWEQGRVRKSRTPTPPPNDGGATGAENASASHYGGRGGGGQQRRLWVKERSKGWWDHYNSEECPDDEFRKAFRMSKATFNMICDELDSAVTKKDTMLRMAIPVRQRVAVCLYRLATGDPLRTVSGLFGLGISTCHKLVLEVCAAIRTVLMPKYLRWPDNQQLKQIKSEFGSISGVPNLGGSIYTTHMSIIAPKSNPEAFFNKNHTDRHQKPSYSTTVQGVVDSRGVFTDICIGYPGSMADDKILEKSALSQRFKMGMLRNTWVVGNSGYPLTDWTLVPYTHQNLTWSQHSFNERIGEVQMIAKEAFMRLKGRWGCLQKRTEVKLQELPMVVGACCVLHNICEMNHEDMDVELRFDLHDDEMVLGESNSGGTSVNALQARDSIAHNLLHHSHSNGGGLFR